MFLIKIWILKCLWNTLEKFVSRLFSQEQKELCDPFASNYQHFLKHIKSEMYLESMIITLKQNNKTSLEEFVWFSISKERLLQFNQSILVRIYYLLSERYSKKKMVTDLGKWWLPECQRLFSFITSCMVFGKTWDHHGISAFL